jgi:hypothetical protein
MTAILSRITARPPPHLHLHLHLRLQPRHLQLQTKLHSRYSSSSRKLPNIPIFQAIKDHDPSSLAVIHSISGRTFTYGNLIGDVLRAREDLRRKAGSSLTGERVGFLAENSYDYVGMLCSQFLLGCTVLTGAATLPYSIP